MHKNILTSNPSNHMPPFQILEDGSLGDLLMVVDMQNVYLEDQPWGCIETTKVIQNIRSLIDQKIPDNILFTQFLPPQHPIGTWKQYNHKNQEINDLVALAKEVNKKHSVKIPEGVETVTDFFEDVFAEIDKLEKSRINVDSYSRTEDNFMPWIGAALLLLLVYMSLRYTLLRRLP